MQCFPFAEEKERTTVIFYEDFSSLLPVLTMTSTHSSCLSRLPSSLSLFISPEWRCEICGYQWIQTQTHTLRHTKGDCFLKFRCNCFSLLLLLLLLPHFGYFLPLCIWKSLRCWNYILIIVIQLVFHHICQVSFHSRKDEKLWQINIGSFYNLRSNRTFLWFF